MAEPLVEIKLNEAELARVRKKLSGIRGAMPRVMSRSINRTAASGRVEVARRIASAVKLTQTVVKKAIRLYKATYTRWRANLSLSDKGIPLIRYGARQLKKGVTYQLARGGGRQLMRGAFKATMPSGHTGVFLRAPRAGRLPIKEQYGPSLGQLFERTSAIAAEIREKMSVTLKKNIDSQVKHELSKKATG